MSAITAIEMTALSGAARATTAPVAAPQECLTFRVGAENYGIDILRVQEIRSYEPPTRLAGTSALVVGVTNLRGVIVPLVDLRAYFQAESGVENHATVTIVLNLGGRVVGVIADAVADVVALDTAEVRPMPRLHNTLGADHFLGVVTLGQGDTERMLVLLDIEALMSSPAIGLGDS